MGKKIPKKNSQRLRFHHRRAKLSAIGPISVGEGKSLGKSFRR
jgi:hypothetical protein